MWAGIFFLGAGLACLFGLLVATSGLYVALETFTYIAGVASCVVGACKILNEVMQ